MKTPAPQTAVNSSILSLDIGNRRVGVAVAGVKAQLPQPLITLINDGDIIDRINRIIANQRIDLIVVGLPKTLNGQDTTQTTQTRQFIDNLKKQIDLPFFWQDEALSSVRAKQELVDRKKPFDKGDIDSLAAVYILEDFINENKDLLNEIRSK